MQSLTSTFVASTPPCSNYPSSSSSSHSPSRNSFPLCPRGYHIRLPPLAPNRRRPFGDVCLAEPYLITKLESAEKTRKELSLLLLPSDPLDARNILLGEIWKGNGGRNIYINDDGDMSNTTIIVRDAEISNQHLKWTPVVLSGVLLWMSSSQVAYSSTGLKVNAVYEVGALFELGIQLSYLLLLLALLGVGSFFVIRQVLLRRELDLSAKELQEQVRSGDANATELFELGAVMLRRKFYPAATRYLLQAIDKWDGEEQDLAQVYNALGVSYVRDGKLEKGISQFETAVKLQPGYVTAWNNLGDAYEKKKELKSALKAFEEVLLFDPNNEVARPRVDSLREKVNMYKGVPIKSKDPVKSKDR